MFLNISAEIAEHAESEEKHMLLLANSYKKKNHLIYEKELHTVTK